MGAGSRFESPIARIGQSPADPGSKVMVCGPLNFHGNDISADVTIHVVQPGKGHGFASMTFPNANHDGDQTRVDDEDDQEWMIPVKIHAEAMSGDVRDRGWTTFVFEPSPPQANGNGVITYHRDDGTIQPPLSWTQQGIDVV